MQVGRDAERRRVRTLLSGARIGQSGVLVITGDAGIGKTSLLDYAAACADGMRVLNVTGSDAERDLPYAGLAQLLRLTTADLDRLPPPQAQALGVALALRSGAGADRFAVSAGTVTLLTQSSEDQALCLLVDDAHLIDRPSQEALAFLSRRLLADAVAVIATARTGEPCALVAPDLPQLSLTGLDEAALRELVVQVEGSPASSELAAQIFAATGGNPLAVVELARDRARLLGLTPGAPAPVPTALARVYSRRAAELDADALSAVQVAAAAGEDLLLITRACTRLGVPVSALARGEEAGLLIIERDRVRFIHPLARSGLYATASPARRRELHAVLADAVGTGDPDRRAWHRYQSVLGPDETVALEMDAVAGRAAGRGAYFVAAQAAERAAELSPGDETAAARLVVAGENAWWAGDARWANQLLDRVARQDRLSAFAVRTRRLRGIIAARTGALDDARDMLLAAASEANEPAEAVACYAEAIYACLYLGDSAHALSAAQATIALLEGVPPEVRVLGLLAAGMGQVLGGLDGSDLLRDAVAELSGRRAFIAQPNDAAYLTLGPLFLRDSHNGRELIQQAVDDHRERAAVGSLPHLLFHIARDGATSDRWPQAEADYTEAIAIAREFGQSTELAASLAGLAWLEARQGRGEQTRAHAAESTELCTRHHMHLARIWACFALADLDAGRRELGAAVKRYAELEQLLTELGIADVDVSPVPELVEAMIMAGSSGGAAAPAQEYDRRAEAKGRPWARARAARVRGLLADEDRMDHHFAAALVLHALTPDDFEQARTQLAYGTRLRRVRRRVDARPPLQAALHTFDRLGARPWATLAAQELAATGASVTRPGETPVSQLTARELQVALPLIRGRSTRQVAAALFLSPKTVEYHLRNIYTRFGISSRSELASLIGDDAQPSRPPGP